MRAARRATVNATTSRATIAATTGLSVSVLLLAALGVYIVRRLLVPVRAAAAAAERVSGGQLAARVPEIGIGEVALLGRSFNEMAETLQARDWELSLTHDRLQGALREAREVSTMKSNFVANMSHEIRTPLNGVVGMMELLSETPLTSEQREYLSVARASGDALMSVVNDVLDVAKIEAGRLDLEQRDFDLHELVEAACDMVAATAASRSVELQSFVHDGVPQMVCGDRMRVGQILANLMSNAVKFTPEGEVVLEVAVTGREDSKVDVRFEVRDTGIGIAPERIHNLFEPFTPVLTGGGHRILVAEDQPVNWMLVQRMLTKRGYRVDNAVNGEQALKMLETGPYDLVFMDCQMPVLDG
jgi:signal transduction histidine kinase